ncbi:MAG: 2-hydroxyacyl-CoA dehydratase family protein [Candidatus Hydrogenedentes bacterium]|nr:2-hydroxyacyl-CoA dehydratase family protein [Candidatus Hydrogenedentota bacterium]
MTSSILNELRFFQDTCVDCYKTAREAATEGHKVAGYMCSYSPQELLHAAGYFPVRVIGRLGATPRADALMQAFICSFARSTFDAGLSGEFDFLDIMLFAHTCDTMQNLADLWQSNCPGMKTIITSVPNVHAGPASATYFRKELERVRGCIEAIAGPIADERLIESIRLYDRHREQMRNLYALRRTCPQGMTGTEMMSVILSSFLVPKEEHLGHVVALIDALKNTRTDSISDRPKVIVGGSVCQAVDFIAAIEGAGCLVVDDDLCMGTRSYLLPPPSPCVDPMDALTQAYLARTPCPAIHKPGFDPAVLMLERVQQTGADGVVFLVTKFCDPFGFDYPHVNSKLEAAGIPSLMLEIEQHLPVSEQVRTRMEAFVEILQDQKD